MLQAVTLWPAMMPTQTSAATRADVGDVLAIADDDQQVPPHQLRAR